MNVFTDFHHSSLLRSIVLLFEKRLNYAVYRPIGMEWFYNGYWSINGLEDTAKQFLLQNHQEIIDGTPPLNRTSINDAGIYRVSDPGGVSSHRALTFDVFKKMKFDFIIASIPNHIPIYQKLIDEYQPKAKLIIQIGNEWDINNFPNGSNVLASIKQRPVRNGIDALFYHQEFDLDIFKATWPVKTNHISSYINILQAMPSGWRDFLMLEQALKDYGITMSSYGGQCRDGNITGPADLARSMQNDQIVFHVKDGGDGFGHVIHNAYACGRPVITRKSFYKNKLAEELMNDQNTIDLDALSFQDAVDLIVEIMSDDDRMLKASQASYSSFYTCVNYNEDANRVRIWLESLKERQ